MGSLAWIALRIGTDRRKLQFFPLGKRVFLRKQDHGSGPEYSGRGGDHVYTQFLILPPAALAKFHNDPFSIFRAIAAIGDLLVVSDPPSELPPIQLTGRAPTTDQILLAQLAHSPGPRVMGGLLHAALSEQRLVVMGAGGERLLAGLMSCLPVNRRTEFSFSTGLRLSTRRPFRVAVISEGGPDVQRFAHQCGARVFTIEQLAELPIETDPWATMVTTALGQSKMRMLANAVANPENVQKGGSSAPQSPVIGLHAESATYDDQRELDPASSLVGHASHAGLQRGPIGNHQGTQETIVKPPRRDVVSDNPATQEMLERLDDLVYEAIGGKAGSFDELVEYWPEVLNQLGDDTIAESREHYLQHALATWTQTDSKSTQDLSRTALALDVLCLLFPNEDG